MAPPCGIALQRARRPLRWSPSSQAQISPDSGSSKLGSQGDPESKVSKNDKQSKKSSGTIWMKDGEFVRPVEVAVGTSDGVNTSIAADTLQEGQKVVIGETTEAAQTGTKNPFIPQVQQRR